eukprot:TRINITY_DN68013_c7_g5_i1.p1 TRINITY_DN68013_c7_g5~~TRINITY_DN68013_c7_g5_i1.p1  ORF type:complete len:466 (+),score=196.28 TRINITY_DN68013_c7_g5_i1:14-1411(+)
MDEVDDSERIPLIMADQKQDDVVVVDVAQPQEEEEEEKEQRQPEEVERDQPQNGKKKKKKKKKKKPIDRPRHFVSLRTDGGRELAVARHKPDQELEAFNCRLAELSLDQIDRLTAQYSPVILLHPDEEFFPCTIDHYLENVELFFGKDHRVAGVGEVTEQVMLEKTEEQWAEELHRVDSEERLNMRVHVDARSGFNTLETVNDAPFYVHLVEGKTCMGEPVWDIRYLTMYAYNGPYTVLCCIKEGAHHVDFEHLTVRVSKLTGNIVGVRYSSHGMYDGRWLHRDDVPTVYGSHPVAYSAGLAHGHYWEPGTIYRILCCANDHSKDGGFRWSPKRLELVSEPHDPYTKLIGSHTLWLDYRGYWSNDGISTPSDQDWWPVGEEPASNNTWYRRICCLFWPCVKSSWFVRDVPEFALELLEAAEEAVDDAEKAVEKGMEDAYDGVKDAVQRVKDAVGGDDEDDVKNDQ